MPRLNSDDSVRSPTFTTTRGQIALRIFLLCAWLGSSGIPTHLMAQPYHQGLGQTIQINTRFRSFVGRPAWTLIVRDLENGQNIPYLYDITKGGNFWIALTYGREYVITVSKMQFSPYRYNPDCIYEPFCSREINNFCHLESNGHIMRGQSIIIWIDGDLTPYTNTYRCHIRRYPDDHFVVVPQAEEAAT